MRLDAVRWVGQEDPWGCTVAALAMILNCSYSEMRQHFTEQHGERDFSVRGITHIDADQFLAAAGHATARRFKYFISRPAHPWPPEPFGKVHLCEVRCSPESPGHSVVMLADGQVLDPLTPESKRLTDYHEVYSVAAVVPLEGR